MSKEETLKNQHMSVFKDICLEEIRKQKTIIFNECVMANQRAVVEGKVVELRPITYIDLPISSPRYLDAVSSFIYRLMDQVNFEALCGIATQGVPYTFAVSQKYGIPAMYFRKEPQQYGTLSHLSGKLDKGSRVLVVDNLVYSGNTISLAHKALTEAGLEVVGIFTVVDFDTAIERLSATTNLFPLMKVGELYEYLFQHDYFPRSLTPYVQSFIQDQTLFHSRSKSYKEYLSELEKVNNLL